MPQPAFAIPEHLAAEHNARNQRRLMLLGTAKDILGPLLADRIRTVSARAEQEADATGQKTFDVPVGDAVKQSVHVALAAADYLLQKLEF